jgi:hypothetical protein
VTRLLADLEGQVCASLSCGDWFRMWGRHYLPSLARAHQLQQCNKFKDPGVQSYSGELFETIRDLADDQFCAAAAGPDPDEVLREQERAGTARSGRDAAVATAAASMAAPRRRQQSQIDMGMYQCVVATRCDVCRTELVALREWAPGKYDFERVILRGECGVSLYMDVYNN